MLNTTPIISLSVLGKITLLKDLFDEVYIPKTVRREILRGTKSIGKQELLQNTWIVSKSVKNNFTKDFLFDLDEGEAETIVLAKELEINLVSIDEVLGRKVAKHCGLNLIGTVGILAKAKKHNLIPSVKPELETLTQNGIFLSKRLIEKTLISLGEN